MNSSFKLQIDGIEIENKRMSDEFEALINKLKSDLQSVESRFEIKIKESVAQVEKEKKEEFDIALNSAKVECNKLIEAAKAERDEYVALYTKECKLRKALHNKVMEFQGNIRVFCRVRPG